MRWTYWGGWVNVVLGVVLGALFFAIGLGALAPFMLLGLIGSGAFMIWLASGWDSPLEDTAEIHRYGRPANARVLSVGEALATPEGGRAAKLKLNVTPVNESDFMTTRTLDLPGGRVPAVGDVVTVKFDPQSRKNVVLLEQNFQVESPTAQAMRMLGGMSAATRGPGAG